MLTHSLSHLIQSANLIEELALKLMLTYLFSLSEVTLVSNPSYLVTYNIIVIPMHILYSNCSTLKILIKMFSKQCMIDGLFRVMIILPLLLTDHKCLYIYTFFFFFFQINFLLFLLYIFVLLVL